MQLLITASNEYVTTRDLAEKHEIQETWIKRKNTLLDQADLCAESLDVVLAFADDLDLRASKSETGGETKAEPDSPDNTTALENPGRAS
jgi:hypothetical protein